MNILDEASYPDTEPVYKNVTEMVQAAYVNRGDVLNGVAVANKKSGTKWVEFRGKTDKLIMRVLLSRDVEVTRQIETEESRETRRRAMHNQGICRRVQEDARADVRDVQKRLNDDLDSDYGRADYSRIGSLLEAQAYARVQREFQSAMEWLAREESDFEGDAVDAAETFMETLREWLTGDYHNRAISRSSNVLSNLMEDIDSEARAKFIENSKWWRY